MLLRLTVLVTFGLVTLLQLHGTAVFVAGDEGRTLADDGRNSTLTLDARRRLMDRLFSNYRKELRPVREANAPPTNVSVQLYLKQIQKIHESDQTLTLHCWLEEYWTDEYLRWEPDAFGGISDLHVPASMVWKPDLLVYNNANMDVESNEIVTNVAITSEGRISLFRALITDVTCDLNMKLFPFDQQICFIMLASWSYDGSQVMLQLASVDSQESDEWSADWGLASSALTHYIPNMEWSLVDFAHRRNRKFYECCSQPYPDISYFFAIKRSPAYYLFTLIIPSAFITIVTVIGFFTPHSSTGENTEKVSLGVTALLSLAIILMMVADKLPATSNGVPLLGSYYIGLILIMFLATYCTTLTLDIQMRGNAGHPIPPRMRNALLSLNSNSVVLWVFGGELLNVQRCIKIRLKRGDALLALMRGTCSNSGMDTLAKTSIAQNHIDLMANRWNDYHINTSILNGIDTKIDTLASNLREIRDELVSGQQNRLIRREWQMLARVIEKAFMWLFIVFTIIFALYMLNDTQELPRITAEYMRAKGGGSSSEKNVTETLETSLEISNATLL